MHHDANSLGPCMQPHCNHHYFLDSPINQKRQTAVSWGCTFTPLCVCVCVSLKSDRVLNSAQHLTGKRGRYRDRLQRSCFIWQPPTHTHTHNSVGWLSAGNDGWNYSRDEATARHQPLPFQETSTGSAEPLIGRWHAPRKVGNQEIFPEQMQSERFN